MAACRVHVSLQCVQAQGPQASLSAPRQRSSAGQQLSRVDFASSRPSSLQSQLRRERSDGLSSSPALGRRQRLARLSVAAAPRSDDEPSSPENDSPAPTDPEADALTSEFLRFVTETQQQWPLADRNPTALLPPTAVVRAQMDALMRNDWPEADSGIQTAFNFAMPHEVERILPGKARPPVKEARAWDASERYLTVDGFKTLLREPMYAALLHCEAWEFTSPMTFHGKGDSRALQAVKVRAAPTALTPSSPSGAAAGTSDDSMGSAAAAAAVDAAIGGGAADLFAKTREYTFTFCLQRVSEGAFKGCWMVVGLRVGDYANV